MKFTELIVETSSSWGAYCGQKLVAKTIDRVIGSKELRSILQTDLSVGPEGMISVEMDECYVDMWRTWDGVAWNVYADAEVLHWEMVLPHRHACSVSERFKRLREARGIKTPSAP